MLSACGMIDPRYILLTRMLRARAYFPFASDEVNPLPISLREENEYIYQNSSTRRSLTNLIEKIPGNTINWVIEMLHSLHLEVLIIILYTLPSAIAQSQSQRWPLGTLASASSVHPSILPGGERVPETISEPTKRLMGYQVPPGMST